MHEQLPFDSEKTIREVGEGLLTRIKDPESQSIIRAFLVQQDG